MEKFDEQVLEVLERAGEYFAIETVNILTKSLRRQKLVNTRQLINSLSAENRTDVARVVHSVAFAFEQYGRYVDMKNKNWNHQPPVEEILEWIKKKGLASFGTDPKPNKKKPKTPERRMNEIAWGIARQYVKARRPVKARSWFNRNFFKALNALQEELILGISDRTVEQMKESLLYRMKKGATTKYF
jgi:enoyl-[acyl-carrier-protein] reductase (NADH)